MTRPPRLRLAAAFAVAVASAGCAGESFVRAEEDDDGGRLELTWVTFAPPAGRPPVLLVNMVHYGAPEFYARVQDALDRSAVVLMEGVRRSPRASPAAEAGEAAPLARLEAAYRGAARELDLVLQADALAARPGWRRPDVTEAELGAAPELERYVAGAESFRRALEAETLRLVADLIPRHPGVPAEDLLAFARRGPLRRAAARALAESDAPEDAVVIVRRNEAALRDLLALRDVDGRVALCFGAAHGPHFARRLVQLGWDRAGTERVAAFDYVRRPRFRGRRRRAA